MKTALRSPEMKHLNMKHTIQVTALVIFTLLVVVPPAAFSEVKISLRNGREIMAESCSESKDRLTCQKMGGTFEIEKQDILDFRSTTIKHEKAYEGPVPGPVPGGEGQKEANKATTGTQDPARPGEGVLIRGANPEQEIRLDRINQRKLELVEEREKLQRGREQLQQEIKQNDAALTTTDNMTTEKFRELQKKANDLDSRIIKFSSELKALNEEETSLLRGPQQTP